MDLALIGALSALALIDSTSIGTIGVPIFLLAARVDRSRILVFLGTITLFYFLVGLMIMLGFDTVVAPLVRDIAEGLGRRGQGIALIIAGAAIYGLGEWLERRRKHAPERSWVPVDASPRAYILLALTAGVLELATMVPYISAIGLLVAADISAFARTVILLGYTLLMILPALALLGAVTVLGRRLDPMLDRIGGWIQKNADGMMSWGFAIVGIIVALNGLGMLI